MRRVIFSIALVFVLAIFAGCSEHKKNIFEPEFEGVDFDNDIMNFDKHDYFISIQRYVDVPEGDPELKTHFVWFGALNQYMEIKNVELVINDVVIAQDWNFGGDYMFSYSFQPGNTYQFEIKANDSYTKAQLKIPYTLQVYNFPQRYNPNEDYELKWTVEKDNQAQFVNVFNGVNDYLLESIKPKLRSYNIKKECVPEDVKSCNLYVYDMNYVSKDRFVLFAITGDQKLYSESESLAIRSGGVDRDMVIKMVREILLMEN